MSGLRKMVRTADIKGNTAYDIILRAFLEHKVKDLSEELAVMLSRWEMVDKLYRKGELIKNKGLEYNKRLNFAEIAEFIIEKFTVSKRTAYEDIRNAQRFFMMCDTRPELEYARSAREALGDELMYAAWAAGDFKAAQAFYKEVNKVKGLHEVHVDLPNYEEFIPPSIVITTDPTELGFEKVENVDEVVARILNEKRNGFIDTEAEDAEVLPGE